VWKIERFPRHEYFQIRWEVNNLLHV
jgi:hypothetical protein